VIVLKDSKSTSLTSTPPAPGASLRWLVIKVQQSFQGKTNYFRTRKTRAEKEDLERLPFYLEEAKHMFRGSSFELNKDRD